MSRVSAHRCNKVMDVVIANAGRLERASIKCILSHTDDGPRKHRGFNLFNRKGPDAYPTVKISAEWFE